MFEVSFRAQHDCPFVRFSAKHPEVRVVHWCSNKTDVLEVGFPDAETLDKMEPDLQELLSWGGGKILKKSFCGGDLQMVVKTCCCHKISPSIAGVVQEHSFLGIPPIIYRGGWEERRVIGLRESDYRKMFQDLSLMGKVEILQKKIVPETSIRDAFVISLSSVFLGLTEKQINSFLKALDYGYYDLPKKVTAEEIARKNGVPRTTYEEHMRKAESKILRAVAPYLRIYASRAPEPGVDPEHSRTLDPI